MSFLPVKYRIALGLTTIVLSTLMVAISLGLGPNARRAALLGRQRLCESIAVNSSILLSQNDLARMKGILTAMVERDDALLSAAVRRSDGRLFAEIGEHDAHWVMDSSYSSESQVHVPLWSNDRKWGTVELRFVPLKHEGLAGLITNPWARLMGFATLATFIFFSIYLKFTLRQLDPKKAIPKRVQFALDNIAEGLLVTDRRGRVLLANEAFAAWAGKRPDQLIGMEATKFPWQYDADNQRQSYPWILAMEQEHAEANFSLDLLNCERNMLNLVAHSSPLLGSDGRYRGVLTSFEDITTLEHHKVELSKAKEAADEANHAKSEFLARMSHEIRTPMNAILGYAEVLRRGFVESESQRDEHLATIQASGEHLLALINDILDLSKIEAGRIELELTRCSAFSVIAQVVSVLRIRAHEKGIYLTPEFPDKLPETVYTDAVRLRQALINLIGNAIKFTEDGGVTVRVRMVAQEEALLAIDIIDTGIGIPADALAKIFQPFSQADTTITRRFGGTGLGLSISKQLAEQLGGDLTVQSERGVGTTFTITIDPGPLDGIPLVDGSQVDLTNEESNEQGAEQKKQTDITLPPARVLVVDDGESNRNLVSVFLSRAGLQVEQAVNGKEAVELATLRSFDVILMDMHMPVMDGFAATRELRQRGLTTEIIALTADVMKSDEKRCREAGCTGFLTKPISMNRLLKALYEVLGGVEQAATQVTTPVPKAAARPATEEEQCLNIQQGVQEIAAAVELATPIVSSLPMDDIDFREIVIDFVTRLRPQVAEMRKAKAQREFEKLAGLAHWLKGAGGTVGFDQFTAPAMGLQTSANGKDLNGIEDNLQQIESILNRIQTPEVHALPEGLPDGLPEGLP